MKIKRVASALLLVAMLTVLTGSAFASGNGVVRTPTKSGTVYLRTGPSTGYAKLGYTRNGDLCTLISKRGNWTRVQMKSGSLSGSYGWLYSKYVVNLRDSSSLSGWGTLGEIKTKYESSGVNLRTGPGKSFRSKTQLHRGDILIILDKYNSRWYEVQVAYSDEFGYVYRDYITNGVSGYATANVNLRSRASNSGTIRTVIPEGSSIRVLNVGTNWSKVEYGRYVGYSYNKYIRLA